MANKSNDYPPEFLELLHSVRAKRPRTVIEHLLEHGTITTAELTELYGYDHAPRAIRDVRELGIPVDKEMITVDGRRMARYRFGDPSTVNPVAKKAGRQQFSKKMKDDLIERYGAVDFLYLEPADPGDLQIDHRIPFEIAGEGADFSDLDQYMLLTNSANRLKSHACENCSNWETKDADMCRGCFWAFPEDYSHVAGTPERIVLLVLNQEEDIEAWDAVRERIGEQQARAQLIREIRKGAQQLEG